jgi:putative ABC transport system permease protein
MRTLREWMHRLLGTLTRRRRDEDLEEELRLHLELAASDARRRGATPQQAIHAAQAHSGAVSQAMESMRDRRGLPWLEELARDVRHGLRTLRRSPVFACMAITTLALGIGANTAIFTIVNGVVLRPLGYPNPEQLMYLSTSSGLTTSVGFSDQLAPAEYFELRQLTRSFAEIGAYTTGEVNLTAGDRPLRVRAAFADEHLMRALGLPAREGRVFATGETEVSAPWYPGDEPPPAAVAILSYELWQTAFGGQPTVGRTIEVDGQRREVVGVMPPGADVMDNHVGIWLPLGLNPATRDFRGYHILSVIGRLADSVTPQAAHREFDALFQNWAERAGLPLDEHVFSRTGTFNHILRMTPLQDAVLGDASRSIWVLQAAVGLVLLIACANLANLFLARAETRRREFAIRAALGATGGRLLRQSITEGVILSTGGGLLGLALAQVGVQAMVRAYPDSLPRTSEVALDVPVLLFTLAVSTATGLIFGLAPIAQTRVRRLATALKEGGDRSGTHTTRHRVRRALVIAEVALAVMLVMGAGLLVRTVYNLTSADAGFDRSRLVTFQVAVPSVASGKSGMPPTGVQTYRRILDEIRGVPGVHSATAMSGLPPSQPFSSEDTDIDNYIAPREGPYESVDYYQSVMSDYFETMGIPIVRGRGFQPSDGVSSGMVAVVNERLVDRFWKGRDPIGQRLRPDWGDWVPWFTVVGVARDIKQRGVDGSTGTEFYFFVEQMANASPPLRRVPAAMNVVLRTTLSPGALSRSIEGAVREVDPAIPVARLRDMERVFAESISRPRLLAQLIGAFAGLALILAAVGTYGVLSYMVEERRREIGIRMALGAGRSSVLALIMTDGLLLTTGGIVFGLGGAFALSGLMASLLFGVHPTDLTTTTSVVVSIAVVAAIACWVPAWRASRVNPHTVLRAD